MFSDRQGDKADASSAHTVAQNSSANTENQKRIQDIIASTTKVVGSVQNYPFHLNT